MRVRVVTTISRAGAPSRQSRDQVECALVGPLQILKNEQQRRFRGKLFERKAKVAKATFLRRTARRRDFILDTVGQPCGRMSLKDAAGCFPMWSYG